MIDPDKNRPTVEAQIAPGLQEDGNEVLYSNKDKAVLKDGTLTVPPASASFIKIK